METAAQGQFGFTETQRVVGEWLESHFGGHIKVGPITIYGFNAMRVALNIRTCRWGYICFHPTIKFYGRKFPWYFYISRNATPWLATVAIGPGVGEQDKAKAKRRRQLIRVLGGR